jgi:hypothetical protein
MAAAKSGFYYLNKMVRIYLIAIKEMIGPIFPLTKYNLIILIL